MFLANDLTVLPVAAPIHSKITAQFAPHLAAFSGFAPEPTIEVQTIQTKWKEMAKRFGIPLEDEARPAPNPLEDYLDEAVEEAPAKVEAVEPSAPETPPPVRDTPSHVVPPPQVSATPIAKAQEFRGPSKPTKSASPAGAGSRPVAARSPKPKAKPPRSPLSKKEKQLLLAREVAFRDEHERAKPEEAKQEEKVEEAAAEVPSTASGLFGFLRR